MSCGLFQSYGLSSVVFQVSARDFRTYSGVRRLRRATNHVFFQYRCLLRTRYFGRDFVRRVGNANVSVDGLLLFRRDGRARQYTRVLACNSGRCVSAIREGRKRDLFVHYVGRGYDDGLVFCAVCTTFAGVHAGGLISRYQWLFDRRAAMISWASGGMLRVFDL